MGRKQKRGQPQEARIPFEDAAHVLEDQNRVMFIGRSEERWHTIGQVRDSFIFLTVIHTIRRRDFHPGAHVPVTSIGTAELFPGRR